MAPTKDYKTLGDDDLRKYVESLGLDTVGPRTTLLDRVSRHLAIKGQVAGQTNGNSVNGDKKDQKQRRRKKKAAKPQPKQQPTSEVQCPFSPAFFFSSD